MRPPHPQLCASQEYCTSSGYQERARDFFESTLGFSIQSEAARWLGVPGALRGAEAIDSIENFVDSAQADEGEWVVGHIICGIVELGGVVYVLIVLIVLSLAIPLAQAVNFFVGILYDAVVLLMAASRSTEEVAGAAPTSGNVQRVKEEKKEDAEKKQKQAKKTKRLSNVFSRSRNKGTKGAGPSDGDKAVEWPNKSPTELATQRDVNRAVASLRRAVAGLTAKNEVGYEEKFAILTKTLFDLRFIRYESLRSTTISELATVKLELERLRNTDVAGLERYTAKSIADVRQLVEQLQGQNVGSSGALMSRRNNPPSTNPFDASVMRSGVIGALAERAQAWFGSRGRGAYDEVSPASEDGDYNDDYHVDDATSDTRHAPSPSERSAMERLGGLMPPV